MTRAELDELETAACPGLGACAGNFTATTMAIAVDALGLGILGDGLIPADDEAGKTAAPRRAGEHAVALVRDGGPTARAFLTPAHIHRAMAAIAAGGGSTNGVLHL